MKKITYIILILICFSCNEKLRKRDVDNDRCWISFEGKNVFIGEKLNSIEKKIEIRPFLEIYPNKGKYISPTETFIFDDIAWIRSINWVFDKDKKLKSITYTMTTTDTGLSDKVANNFSDKNYIRYYNYIDSIRKNNICSNPKIIYSDSSKSIALHPLYKRAVTIQWSDSLKQVL